VEVSGDRHVPAALPREGTPVPTKQEAGWAPKNLVMKGQLQIPRGCVANLRQAAPALPARSHKPTALTFWGAVFLICYFEDMKFCGYLKSL
jgi:hypothetical protein